MGFRTLGLVGLQSCIAVQAIMYGGLPQMNADAADRVIQGLLSGVGFIGAGALLHGGSDRQVHGLATAASIWVSAALGSAATHGQRGAGFTRTLIFAPERQRPASSGRPEQ